VSDSLASPQAVGQDAARSVLVKIGEHEAQRFADDPSAVRAHPELPQREPRSLDREQFLPRAVERDLLVVPLTATASFGYLEIDRFVDRSLCSGASSRCRLIDLSRGYVARSISR